MRPNELADALRRIASGIENSKKPVKETGGERPEERHIAGYATKTSR